MVTYSNILAWRIAWTEEPGGLYSPWGRKELDMTEYALTTEPHNFFHTDYWVFCYCLFPQILFPPCLSGELPYTQF